MSAENNGLKAGSNLEKVLAAGQFAVTAECGPPRGPDRETIIKKAALLKGAVDAVNVTDNQTSIVRMASMAASKLLVEGYKAYGAAPTPMSYGEVYSGLQMGLIDAQVNPLFAIYSMKFYEVQDYVTQLKSEPFIGIPTVNQAFFDGLPQEVQEEMRKFWASYENPLEDLSKAFWNQFLKANNQEKGIMSYSYMVALVINYFEDRPI